MATLPICPHTPLGYNAMSLLELSHLFLFHLLFGDDLCLLSYLFVHLGTLAWFVAVQFCLEKDCVSHVFPEFLTLSGKSRMHGTEFGVLRTGYVSVAIRRIVHFGRCMRT